MRIGSLTAVYYGVHVNWFTDSINSR